MTTQQRPDALIKILRPEFMAAPGVAGGGVGEGPGIDVVGGIVVGLGGDTILLYENDGDPVAEWAMTSAGLDSALATAFIGQIVFLMAGEIDGDHTIPSGVTLAGISRDACRLTGKITLGFGSLLTNLTVRRRANDNNLLVGVENGVDGTGYIRNCTIDVAQEGGGNTYGIHAINAVEAGQGMMHVSYSYLSGSSLWGPGYAAASEAGEIYIWHSKCYGSTDRFWTAP